MKAIDIEQIVIGCLLSGGLTPTARDILSWVTPDMFANNHLAKIYSKVKHQALTENLIDPIMLSTSGNVDFLDLVNIQTSSSFLVANLQGYAKHLKNNWLIRTAQQTMVKLAKDIEKSDEQTAKEITIKAINEMKSLLASNDEVTPISIGEYLDDYIEILEARNSKEKNHNLLKTGIEAVDGILGGINPTDITVIAGRPAMGKTEFALTITRNIANNNGSVLFFSLEMGNCQLVDRIMSAEAKVPVSKLRTAELEEYEFAKLSDEIGRLKGTDIYLVDRGGLSANQITSITEKHLEETGDLSAIVIDYLGLMDHGKGINKNQLIESSLNTLKTFAKNFNVPVILLSQLNRDVDSRADKRPMSSDLRDSGAIEQDASQIIMLYREKAYKKESDNNYSEAIVTKNRFGETGTAYMTFNSGHFESCDQAQAYNFVSNSNVQKTTFNGFGG